MKIFPITLKNEILFDKVMSRKAAGQYFIEENWGENKLKNQCLSITVRTELEPSL